MGKTKSQKILSWETKDIAMVAVTYVLNMIVIGLLFLVAVELTDGLEVYFSNVVTPIHFFILL